MHASAPHWHVPLARPSARFLDAAIRTSRLHASGRTRRSTMVREGFDCMLRAGRPHGGQRADPPPPARRSSAAPSRAPPIQARLGMPEVAVDALEADGTAHGPAAMRLNAPEVDAAQFPGRRADLRTACSLPLVHHRNRSREPTSPRPAWGWASFSIPAAIAPPPRLASGKLLEVLPQSPPPALPVRVLYSRTRQLSPRPAGGDRLDG